MLQSAQLLEIHLQDLHENLHFVVDATKCTNAITLHIKMLFTGFGNKD